MTLRVAISLAAAVLALGCAKRYSADERDWVGPRKRDLRSDHDECIERIEGLPFRFGGDPRLIFLDCMERRGWYLKGRSAHPPRGRGHG